MADFSKLERSFVATKTATATAQTEAQAAYARFLWTQLVVSARRYPTASEALTFLIRWQAVRATLEETLRRTGIETLARLDLERVKAFWTEDCQAGLGDEIRDLIAKISRLAPGDFVGRMEWRTQPIDTSLARAKYAAKERGDEAEASRLQTLRQAWKDSGHDLHQRAQAAARPGLKSIIREAGLAPDETALLNQAADSDQPSPFLALFKIAREGVDALVTALELPRHGIHVRGSGKTVTFADAVSLAREDAGIVLETANGEAFRKEEECLDRILSGRSQDYGGFQLLAEGRLTMIAAKDPLEREAAFRLVVDRLGLDLRQAAAFVARRARRLGGGRMANYFFYPLSGELTACVVATKEDPCAAEIWLLREGLEAAKRTVAERRSPAGDLFDTEEYARLRVTLDPAGPGAPRNPLEGLRADPQAIDGHYELRARYAAELARL